MQQHVTALTAVSCLTRVFSISNDELEGRKKANQSLLISGSVISQCTKKTPLKKKKITVNPLIFSSF